MNRKVASGWMQERKKKTDRQIETEREN